MEYLGRRIIYDSKTGEIIMDFGEVCGCNLSKRPKIEQLECIDLPYGYEIDKFNNAKKIYIDIETKLPIFDLLENVKQAETEEEKLRREKEELENQLLLKENETMGGIL